MRTALCVQVVRAGAASIARLKQTAKVKLVEAWEDAWRYDMPECLVYPLPRLAVAFLCAKADSIGDNPKCFERLSKRAGLFMAKRRELVIISRPKAGLGMANENERGH